MERIGRDIQEICKTIDGAWRFSDECALECAALHVGPLLIRAGYDWGSLGPRGVHVTVMENRTRLSMWRVRLDRDLGVKRSEAAIIPREWWQSDLPTEYPRDNNVWLKATLLEAKAWADAWVTTNGQA